MIIIQQLREETGVIADDLCEVGRVVDASRHAIYKGLYDSESFI